MNKKKHNYFTQNISRNGENFLNGKNSRDLQFDTPRILRDIAKGSLDVRDYYNYFCNRQLINSIIITCQDKIAFHGSSHLACDFFVRNASYANMYVPDNMYMVLDTHKNTALLYNIVLQAFSMFNETLNIDILLPMAGELRNYRQYI